MKTRFFFLLFAINFLLFVNSFAQKPILTVPMGHTHMVLSVAFSPNGKYILSGSRDMTLKLWDINSGKELKTFSGHTNWINSIAFSADGKYALSGSRDKTSKLWDINSGKELKTFSGHTDDVYSVAFSPDSKYVLSGSGDSTLKLWDINTGKEIRTFTGHTSEVNSVAFSPDGNYALSGSDDETLKLWDINSGKEIKTFSGHPGYVSSVAFSPDGNYALSGSFKVIKLWDINSGKEIKTFSGHTDLALSVCFSSDGKYALSTSWNKIKLWDINSGKEIKTFSGHTDLRHTDVVLSVAFSSSGQYALSGSMDKTLKLWDINSGKEIKTFSGHTGWVFSVAFSPDGQYALSGSVDSTLKLWDINSGKEIKTFSGHTRVVSSVAFSSDGQYALSGSADSTLKLWDINSGNEVKTFSGHTNWVKSVAFSPDGQYVLSGSSDNTLKLWDINSGKEVKTFSGHTGNITICAFSPDGKYILSGSGDNTLRLWDINTGKEIRTFTGHSCWIFSVAFSPDGKHILSGSCDNKMKLWNVETGNEIASLISLDSADWAVVTPEGQFDASSDAMKLMYFVSGTETIDLEQLKERYYEPGLLAKLMGYNSEPMRDVKGFTDVQLFPNVTLTAPTGNDKYLKISLTDRGGGIGKVRVLVNGKELTGDARGIDEDFKPDEKNITLKVDISKSPYLIPGVDNKIEVFAFNAEGYLSSRGYETYFTPSGTTEVMIPELYVVSIGVSEYEEEKIRLKYASKDAEDFANAMRIGGTRLFGKDKCHIKILNTSGKEGTTQPLKKNIVSTLESLKNVKQRDILVIYLSGHGINVGSGSDNEEFYYLTKEARSGNLSDPEIRKLTSISSTELTELMLKIPALKQVLILDVCGSGKMIEKLSLKRDIPSGQVRVFERMKDRVGLYILTGCSADAVSYEASKFAQGLLTYSLLMGMKGAALREQEFVDVNTLFEFAANKVPELAKNIGGIQQPRIFGKESFDLGQITSEDKENIPLSKERPLILQCVFQDAKKFIDHLGLTKKINDALREVSSKGQEAKLIYLDAIEFPDAYFLAGQYSLDETGAVNIQAKIFLGEKEVGDFTFTGSKDKIDDLVKEIIEKLQTNITSNK